MTYETGTAVDVEDLLGKLDTFARTTHGGWATAYSPNPNTTNGWFELNKGSLSFSSKFPVGGQAPVEDISIHQAVAPAGAGIAPGKHTGDSGNGYNATDTGHSNANLALERCVRDIGDGPFPSYHFFADDTGPGDYVHVVVEATSGMFRHFGFGLLDKFGDNWTGGEYVYGHYHDTATNATAVDLNHQTLLDGLGSSSDEFRAATVRTAAGLLNQGTAVWSVAVALSESQLDPDTAGNPRTQVHGTFRSGMEPRGFANSIGNLSAGVVPLYSIGAYYRDPNNPRVQLLGYVEGVRALNNRNFAPAEEVQVGAETWIVFPMSIKTQANIANRSQHSGIAYRKVL